MQANIPINNIVVDLSLSVLKAPMSRDAFVTQLQSAQQAMFPEKPLPRRRQIKFNDCTASIKYFADFINAEDSPSINPTEAMLDKFLDYLLRVKGADKAEYCGALINNLRNIINHFPLTVLQRQLVNGKRNKYLTRLDRFGRTTRDFLEDFLKDGRMLNKKRHRGGPILSSKLLSPGFRQYIVWVASNFLNSIGKTCLLTVTTKDAEAFIQFYDAQGRRDLALRYLADLQRVFLHLVGKGLRDKNPIEQYDERPPIKINDDFVMPEPMDVLKDLSTVDFQDFLDVRDRMLVFALCYDFCLRDGEIALLKVTDVALDGNLVALTLRSEVQKGQNKPQVTLYNCFDESRRLMQAYLELRTKYFGARCEDSLMISDKKRRLTGSGVRDAVERHCTKLGILTRKGDCPTPHEFRHAFATINIDRGGLCLSPYYIQGRLRHADLETTIKTYVNNNPLLAKLNHIASIQGTKAQGSLPFNAPDATALPAGCSQSNDIVIPEAEAVRVLRPLGIVAQSLRQYAETKGIAEKKNNQLYYLRSFVLDLSKHSLSKQQIMKRFNFGVSGFYKWKKSRGIEPIVIGRRSFVRASDVINEMKK